MVDSNLPRFSQAVQALVLAIAFILDARVLVPIMAALLIAASVGGPRFNVLAYAYKALPVPRGEPEPAAPPRFAQTLGAVFLTIGSIFLVAAEAKTTAWWILGWGPAIAVAVLAAIAATTTF